jgi:hypothetical protein
MPRDLGPGVYGPLPTFFDDDQQINYDDYSRHLLSELSISNVHRLVADFNRRLDAASQGISRCCNAAND